jgi:hypothetical protein
VQRGTWQAVFAGGHFVQHFPQRVDVRLRRPGTLRSHEPFGAYVRARAVQVGHQTDVRQAGRAGNEDDVGRLDVAMDQAVLVEVSQGTGEREADADAFVRRELAAALDVYAQGAGT